MQVSAHLMILKTSNFYNVWKDSSNRHSLKHSSQSEIWTFSFRREITALAFENTVFESSLERKKSDPISHHVSSAVPPPTSSSQATTPTGSIQDLPTNSAVNRTDRVGRKRSRSRSTQADFRVQLTTEQKLEIIVAEYEHTRNEKLRQETNYEKDVDQLEVCCCLSEGKTK